MNFAQHVNFIIIIALTIIIIFVQSNAVTGIRQYPVITVTVMCPKVELLL